MVPGKLPVPGCPTIWMIVGQWPIALAVGAGGGCLDIFTLLYLFFSLPPSLWETARYRLKYCLKGPLNPNQPTNQNLFLPISIFIYNKKSNKEQHTTSKITREPKQKTRLGTASNKSTVCVCVCEGGRSTRLRSTEIS